MTKTVHKEQTHLTIDEALKTQATEYGNRAGLSLSNVVSISLFEYLEKHMTEQNGIFAKLIEVKKEKIEEEKDFCPFCKTYSLKLREIQGANEARKTNIKRIFCMNCCKIVYAYDTILNKWIKTNGD